MSIAGKILTLCVYILIGYLAAIKTNLSERLLSKSLVWFLIPIVVILTVSQSDFDRLLVIPAFYFVFQSVLTYFTYLLIKRAKLRTNRNLYACAYGYANVGWFGLPVVSALFGTELATSTIIGAYLGNNFYGNTVAFYLMANEKRSLKKSMQQVLKNPGLYAYIIGAVVSFNGWVLPQSIKICTGFFQNILAFLGMALIGFVLPNVNFQDYKRIKRIFISIAPKYVIAPVLMAALLTIDSYTANFFPLAIQKVLFLSAFFPVAANLITLAVYFETDKAETALLIVISTVISIVFLSVFSYL